VQVVLYASDDFKLALNTATMITAWSLSEIIRYSFYAIKVRTKRGRGTERQRGSCGRWSAWSHSEIIRYSFCAIKVCQGRKPDRWRPAYRPALSGGRGGEAEMPNFRGIRAENSW
jgi:hypothetical protein